MTRKRSSQEPCPWEKRDGRCCPGAWLCRHCGNWHYLKRNPVRRGTVRAKRNGDPIDWKLLW